MMLGCGCNKDGCGGLGAAYENGVLIPSTNDPSNTPVVMNPTPGQNMQIAASVVPTGTLSSSGQACNVLGGYTWNGAQCVSAGSPAPVAQQAPSGYVTTTDPATGSTMYVPASQVPAQAPTSPTNPITGTTAAQPGVTANSSGDIMIGTFDVSSFFSTYGMWVVGGVAAVLLLSQMHKR